MEFNLRKFLEELRKHLARDEPPYREKDSSAKVARYDWEISRRPALTDAPPMTRREMLIGVAMGAALIAQPVRAFGYNALRHPLVSTVDKGTTLDETRAAKARKLAEYVVTRDKQPNLLSYDPNSDIDGVIHLTDSQVVQAVMVVDGQRYTVVVFNNNEKGGLKLPSGGFSQLPDSMYFWVRPEDTKGEDTLIKFNDYSLDGRCNSAFIPAKLSGIGKNIVYSTWSSAPTGLEHTARVQALYDKTLDALIKFYERPKAK